MKTDLCMEFKEISFMDAMKMLEDGKIKDLYFWAGGSLEPANSYKTNYADLTKKRFFEKIGE